MGAATLTATLTGDIDDFDPHTNQLIEYEWAIKLLVFDSLVRYDAKLGIVPGVARPEVSSDATEFTFHLKDGVKFTDGTPLDAAAAVKSLKRAATSKGIWASRLAGVKSFDALDPQTVVIKLKGPNAAFLDGLAHIALMAPGSFSTARSKPVGSGPFKFVSRTPNSEIVLERNDDYWGEKPAYQKLVLRPIGDEQVASTDLYSGAVDIVSTASSDLVAQVDESKAQVVRPEGSNSTSLIEFNSQRVPVEVRRAMGYAFDREAVRKIAYGGEGETKWTPLPSDMWAYKEETGYPYDVGKAKELVAQAGGDRKVTLESLTGYPEAQKMARVWQQALKKAGITLEVRTNELSAYLDKFTKRDYDAIWGYFNVSADPDSFFDVIMKPHLEDDYKSPEMEKLIAEGVSSSDEATRTETYGKLQDLLVRDLPVMPIQSRPQASLAATNVKGLAVNSLGWPLLAGVEVK